MERLVPVIALLSGGAGFLLGLLFADMSGLFDYSRTADQYRDRVERMLAPPYGPETEGE